MRLMKKTATLLLSLFISGIGFCQQYSRAIDSLMNTFYRKDAPGAAIEVQYDNQIIFSKGYGLADLSSGETISTGTNFNIGSLTKQFTAFAILQLQHEKKLSLEDKLSKYFPELTPLIGNPVNIRQLLSHCSGLPDHYGFTDTSFVKHATDEDVLRALEKADTLIFTPGSHYRYSNTAYCLLGLIVEKRSGLPYDAFIRQLIFTPLNMKGSTVFKYDSPIQNRAKGYEPGTAGDFKELDADQSVFFSTEADGGIYTTIGNYLRWCISIQQGSFSTTDALQQAWTPQCLVDTLKKLSYGYGWFISGNDSRKTVYHTGSNGGFRSVVFMIPAARYTVAIFSNRSDIDLEDIVLRINHLLHMGDKTFVKTGPLESFIDCWPIFAPCKEIPPYLISSIKNLNVSVMDWN
jgi:D-alanyl-D-alanine carboxypeptidase